MLCSPQVYSVVVHYPFETGDLTRNNIMLSSSDYRRLYVSVL